MPSTILSAHCSSTRTISPASVAARPPGSSRKYARRWPRQGTRRAMVAGVDTVSRLPENIMQFARALRAAGLPVGPGKAIDAIEAVKAVGIGERDDFYWTLHAVFVQRREQREIFDQAFHIFWRNPQFLKRMMSLMLPQFRAEVDEDEHREISPRVADALRGNQAGLEGDGHEPEHEE